jgi:O-antigen ligase
MIRTHTESKEIKRGRIWKDLFKSLRFPTVAIVILICGVVGLFISLVFSKIFSGNAVNIAGVSGAFSLTYIWGFIIGALLLAIVLILHQYELAVIGVIGIHLYIDWYLGLTFVASILALFLLLLLFIVRHYQRQLAVPRALWLWVLFLALAIFQTTKAPSLLYGADYYLNVIFDALIMLWIGILIAQDYTHVRRFFQILSLIGILIALHTIIEATTGVFLFQSSRNAANTTIISYLNPLMSGVHRAESFLLATDTNGAFLALMFFAPLALFTVSSSFVWKLLFITEMFVTLFALLFTYSTGAWLSVFVGIIVYMALVGRARLCLQIFLFLIVAGIVGIVFFPSQLNLLLYHSTTPGGLSLRTAVWQTGIRVIEAFPLTGLGIGRDIYLLRAQAQAYSVPAQYVPVSHPHNSFLEFAALGGLPVGIVFIVLLSITLWVALRNWMHTDVENRPLLAGGIASVIALSWFSLSDAGWTVAPLALIGWLIAGIVASPLIGRGLRQRSAPPVDRIAEIVHALAETSRIDKS